MRRVPHGIRLFWLHVTHDNPWRIVAEQTKAHDEVRNLLARASISVNQRIASSLPAHARSWWKRNAPAKDSAEVFMAPARAGYAEARLADVHKLREMWLNKQHPSIPAGPATTEADLFIRELSSVLGYDDE
jgi:hypothetical protein